MKETTRNHIPFYLADNLLPHSGISHFFATRNGGGSRGALQSLNVGLSVNDYPEDVWENRRRIAEAWGITRKQMLFPQQTHSNKLALIDTPGSMKPEHLVNTDALITRRKQVLLCVQTADCAPVIYYDPVHHAVGIAHAGWRGAVNGILQKVTEAMHVYFQTEPKSLQVAIGPSIGPEVYEVRSDVQQQVLAYYPKSQADHLLKPLRGDTFAFNLWHANKLQLLMAGVPESQIEVSGLCTYSHPEKFYSARYNQGNTGRLCSGVFIK